MESPEIAFGVVNVVALAIVLIANAIVGQNIRRVSDSMPTPLTPPPQAFSIWGLLYVLLTTVCVAQFYDLHIVQDLSGWFALSCAGTIAWLMAYTRTCLKTSFVVLALTTTSIGFCYARVQGWATMHLAHWPRAITTVTFSLYFGWTLVASALNALQASPWQEYISGNALQVSTYAILYATLALLSFLLKDPCVGLPFAWATLWRGVVKSETSSLIVGVMVLLTSISVAVRFGIMHNEK